jgi:hypothetical protein
MLFGLIAFFQASTKIDLKTKLSGVIASPDTDANLGKSWLD